MAKIGASDHRSDTQASMGKMEETATGAKGGASEKASGEKRLIAYGRIGPGFVQRSRDFNDRDIRDPDRAVFIAPADRHGMINAVRRLIWRAQAIREARMMINSGVTAADLVELTTELEKMRKAGASDAELEEERRMLSQLMLLRADLRGKSDRS